MHTQARRLGHGLRDCTDRAFAIRPRYMQNRRQASLWRTQLHQQPLEPINLEIDHPGIKTMQALERRTHLQPRATSPWPNLQFVGQAAFLLAVAKAMIRPSMALKSPRLTTMSIMPCLCRYSAR